MPRMMIALMSPPEASPAFSHLPPVYRFSEEARDRGYEIIWTCSKDMASRVAQDYPQDTFRTYPNPTFLGTPRLVQPLFRRILSADIPQRMLPRSTDERNHEWLFDSYAAVGFDEEQFFMPAVETALKAMIEFEPDAMFTYGCPVGLTAAHIAGVPAVTFDNLMRLRNEGGDSYRRMNETVQRAMEVYAPPDVERIPLEDIIRNDGQFRILSTIQHLGRKPYSDNEVFVGGFEPPRVSLPGATEYNPPEIDSESRTVYGYFGSGSISFRLVRKILPEVFDEVNYLCGTPYDCYVSSQFVEKPFSAGSVHFAPYFDASQIVPMSTYVFSHGGINSVMQALSHGVPLIMVPGSILERRHNAHEVTAVYCGIEVEIEDFTVPHLSSLLLDHTQELELRRNAQRQQGLIEQAGGIRKAFEEMERRWLAPYSKDRLPAIARRLLSA
ncbi:MAG: glycosyltransferase [Candidatus Promineifilaceae bacterium]